MGRLVLISTLWKVSKYGVCPGQRFSVRKYPYSVPNTEKYGPEKTPYLDTFHVVLVNNEMIEEIFSYQ